MEPLEYEIMFRSEEHHWWYAGLHDLVLGWIKRTAAQHPQRPLDILDAGCGTGYLGQLMQNHGVVTGCDLHPLALKASRRRGLDRVRAIDLAAEPLGDREYDVITCLDVLVHQTVKDEKEVLRNFHRALRLGGLLVLQVAAFECLRGAHDHAVHAVRRFRRPGLNVSLREAGFDVLQATYRMPWLFFPAWLWRRASLRQSPPPGSSEVARSDSPTFNRLLKRCLTWENRYLLAGGRFPLGTSLFAIARKR